MLLGVTTTSNQRPAAPAAPAGRLQHLPITLFASVMGLGGLSLAWRRAALVWDVSPRIAQVIFWIAPVGHTCPQSTQVGSQYPMRGIRMGVHKPSMPLSSKAGWRALLGQTFIHSAQRMHRSMNSRSGTEPGGRLSRAW